MTYAPFSTDALLVQYSPTGMLLVVLMRAHKTQGKAARRRSVIRSRPNGGRLGKRIAKYAKLPEKE